MLDSAHSRIEDRHGNPAAALGILEAAQARLRGSEEGAVAFMTTALRVQVDAEAGRAVEAAQRLATLGSSAASSPSLSRRLAYLSARAAVGQAEGRADAARADLSAAIAATQAAGWKLDELDLRLDLAALDFANRGNVAATQAARAVAAEAEGLGLRGIASRARALEATASQSHRG